MRAIVYHEYGSPDVLRLEEIEVPVPKPGEVLVRVCAASVNDWDWGLLTGDPINRMLNGLTKPKLKVLGGDIAGRVEAVGSQQSELKPGDAVYGDLCNSGFGAFAEYVCAPLSALCKIPDGMTFEQAAAIPQAGMLAVQGLFDVGWVDSERSKILLNGAGGGVGTIALQLLKPYDVEVTCVDSAGKLDTLRDLGADHVIDYAKQDFTRSGQQFDLILDPKTNRSPFAYARALNPGGIYATVGGSIPRLLQAFLFGRMISLPGESAAKKHIRIVSLKPNKDLAFINEQFEAGNLVPVIDGPYDFADTADAIRHFASGKHIGKIVISIS